MTSAPWSASCGLTMLPATSRERSPPGYSTMAPGRWARNRVAGSCAELRVSQPGSAVPLAPCVDPRVPLFCDTGRQATVWSRCRWPARAETGTREAGRARRVRGCPRNCRRRARFQTPLPRWARRRNQARTREPGDRPASRLRAATGGVYRGSGFLTLMRLSWLSQKRARARFSQRSEACAVPGPSCC